MRVGVPRRRRALIGCAVICAAAVAAGCSGDEGPWASVAEEYFDAYGQAYGTGFTNVAPFYAPDVTVDMRGFAGYTQVGRAAAVQALRGVWGSDAEASATVTRDEPVYLSRDGAVDPTRLVWEPWPVPRANVYSIDATGIVSETFAGSILAGELYYGEAIRAKGMAQWAQEYVAAWSASDPAAVAGLYAQDAVLRDSLAGLRVEGADRIGHLADADATTGGLPGAVLRTIPEEGGSAAYFNGGALSEGSVGADRGVLLLTVDEGDGCPGQVATALWLTDRRITREERYHRVDALRRCTDPRELPTGWWDTVVVPDPTQIRVTGTVTSGATQTQVWSGPSQAESLLSWAASRFTDTALDPPHVTSVTFLPAAGDQASRFGFLSGEGAGDLAVEVLGESVCPDADCAASPVPVKAKVLREYADLWLHQNLSQWARDKFAEQRGMVWSDPSLPWAQQAGQVAVETVVWGLMDEPYLVDPRRGTPSCAELEADFEELTNAAASPQSCAELPAGRLRVP